MTLFRDIDQVARCASERQTDLLTGQGLTDLVVADLRKVKNHVLSPKDTAV